MSRARADAPGAAATLGAVAARSRMVAAAAALLEPQRVCHTETVGRPAAPAPPEGLRPAEGGRRTGIVVESEPEHAPAAPKK